MATLRRRIVTQFCRGLEGELVLERYRPQLEQPQNDILGRRAPGNGPEDIPLPAIDLYIYIYIYILVEIIAAFPWRRSESGPCGVPIADGGPPLVVPLLGDVKRF